MSASDLAALHERVERLERQNRRFKCGAVCLALTALCGVIMGAAGGEGHEHGVVKARAFVVEDEQGNQRAYLGPLQAGESDETRQVTELTLTHPEGESRISLLAQHHAASLRMAAYPRQGADQYSDASIEVQRRADAEAQRAELKLSIDGRSRTLSVP
jgi:hypothetical protein